MTDELTYQRHIVKSININGGYALKMHHAFLTGVPDLLLKLVDWPCPQIWEVKKIIINWDKFIRPMGIASTPLQRRTLGKMKQAGIQVAILIVLPGPGRSDTLFLTRHVEQHQLKPEELTACHYVRRLGEPWHNAILQLDRLTH